MADYALSYLSITNDLGDGVSGTLLDEAFFDGFVDDINTELAEIEADVEALQTQGYLKDYDTVIAEYKDAATITLQADGQFTSSDGAAFYAITANTDVGFSTNLSSDVGGGEANSTLYYIWGGEDSNGDLEFWITDSATSMPSELVRGKRLRFTIYNDGSGNILPFYMSDWYYYDVDADGGGSDATEVLDATVGTTFTDVDCSDFVPAGVHEVLFNCTSVGSLTRWFRPNGSSKSTGIKGGAAAAQEVLRYITDDNGIFECRQSSSASLRISLIAYRL